jgi:hypothetical protein
VGLFGGVNRVLPPARPPARRRPNPRAAPRRRQRPPRAASRSSIRRPLALFRCRRSADKTGPAGPVFVVDRRLSQAPGDSTAQTTNVQGQRPRHIFRRCQQMASHLAVAPLPRATAPSSPMICLRQPSYGWIGQQSGSGVCDLAPSILHYNWF